MDSADPPPTSSLKHLLVIVDPLSRWVAFPTRKAETAGVIKALLWEIIPDTEYLNL